MRYYTYMNRNEILSLMAQVPEVMLDIDTLTYINSVSTRISTDLSVAPELYYRCGKGDKRNFDLRTAQFESRDCSEIYIATNIQEITDAKNLSFFYSAIGTLVSYAKNNGTIYYDQGSLTRPVSRSIKRKKKLFSRSIEEVVEEEIINANYMLLNGAKIISDDIPNIPLNIASPMKASAFSLNNKQTPATSSVNEIYDSSMNVLGHYIQKDDNGKIVKPIAMYIDY